MIERAVLTSTGGQAGDHFGQAVALDGPLAVVGAPDEDHLGPNAGAAHLFEKAAGGWQPLAALHASDGAPGDEFGAAVAIDAGTVAVGAPEHDAPGGFTGTVYLFAESGSGWVEIASLTASHPDDAPAFGVSLDFDRDVLVVGAADPAAAGWDGAVYVFERVGGAWSETARLTASAPGATELAFGTSVAVDGDRIVVGAPHADGAFPVSGAAYVFERVGAGWIERTKLVGQGIMTGLRLGQAVDLLGSRAAVGVPDSGVVGGGTQAGRVILFQGSGAAWTEEARLAAPDADDFDQLGSSVALGPDFVVAGAPFDDDAGNSSGSAHAFALESASWVHAGKLVASDAAAEDTFGWALAVDRTRILCGANHFSTVPGAPGAAYEFELLGPPEPYCAGKLNSLGCVPHMAAVGDASASVPIPFLLEARDALPDQPGILFYGHGRANVPYHGGSLCVATPRLRFPPKLASPRGTPPCSGVLSRDFNRRIQSGPDPLLTAGATVFAQWLQNDPADPAGYGDSLTDAVHFPVKP